MASGNFMTAFNLFTKDNFRRINRMTIGASSVDITHILAQLWKDLPDAEKEYYQEMAKAYQQGVDGHCTSRRKRSTKKRIRKIKECIDHDLPLLLPKPEDDVNPTISTNCTSPCLQCSPKVEVKCQPTEQPVALETKLVVKETKTDNKLLKSLLSVLVYSLDLCDTCSERNDDFIQAIQRMRKHKLLLPKGNTPRLSKCRNFPLLAKKPLKRGKRGTYKLRKKRGRFLVGGQGSGASRSASNTSNGVKSAKKPHLELSKRNNPGHTTGDALETSDSELNQAAEQIEACLDVSLEAQHTPQKSQQKSPLISPTHDTLRRLLQDLDLDARQQRFSNPSPMDTNMKLFGSSDPYKRNTKNSYCPETKQLSGWRECNTMQNPDIATHLIEDCFQPFNIFLRRMECNESFANISSTSQQGSQHASRRNGFMSPSQRGEKGRRVSRCNSFINALNNIGNNTTVLNQLENQLQQFENEEMHSSQRNNTEGTVSRATNGCDGPRASTPIESDQSYSGLDKRWNLSTEWQPLITNVYEDNERGPDSAKGLYSPTNSIGQQGEYREIYLQDIPSFRLTRHQIQDVGEEQYPNSTNEIAVWSPTYSPPNNNNASVFINTADMLRLFRDIPDMSCLSNDVDEDVKPPLPNPIPPPNKSESAATNDAEEFEGDRIEVTTLIGSIQQDIADLQRQIQQPRHDGNQSSTTYFCSNKITNNEMMAAAASSPCEVDMSINTSAATSNCKHNSSDYFPMESDLSSDHGLGQSLTGFPSLTGFQSSSLAGFEVTPLCYPKTTDSLFDYSASAESNADVSRDGHVVAKRKQRKRKQCYNHPSNDTSDTTAEETSHHQYSSMYDDHDTESTTTDPYFGRIDSKQTRLGSATSLNLDNNKSTAGQSDQPVLNTESLSTVEQGASASFTRPQEYDDEHRTQNTSCCGIGEISKHDLSVLLDDSYFKAGEEDIENLNSSELEGLFETILTDR